MAISMPLGARIYRRTGPQFLIALGLFVNAVSFYLLSRLTLDVGYWDIFFPQFLQGIGFGFIFVSLSTAVLSTIEKPLMTAASGLYNVIRQVFASVGIALAATFLTRGEIRYRAVLTEHVTSYSDATVGCAPPASGVSVLPGGKRQRHRHGGIRASGGDGRKAGRHACLQPCLLSYRRAFPSLHAPGPSDQGPAEGEGCGDGRRVTTLQLVTAAVHKRAAAGRPPGPRGPGPFR